LAERIVLVELFTSQGCDLCPEAERVLGSLGDRSRRIVPIAFHVDYFNAPWHDPYSDRLYSERQKAYALRYPKPKPPQPGLYYTPMLMIDGVHSVNGRDRLAAEAAIRQALQREPGVALSARFEANEPSTLGELRVQLAARSPLATDRLLLVGAVVRDDAVTNRVLCGENANQDLVARFPARQARFEHVTLTGSVATPLQFTIPLDPAWTRNGLRVAVFVQDSQSGVIHQALDLPWRPRLQRRSAR